METKAQKGKFYQRNFKRKGILRWQKGGTACKQGDFKEHCMKRKVNFNELQKIF